MSKMRLFPLRFGFTLLLLLPTGSLCYNWRDFKEDWPIVKEYLQLPIFLDLEEIYEIAYERIIKTPKGLQLLDSIADLVDFTVDRNYNWTAVNDYLNSQEIPRVNTLLEQYFDFVTGVSKDDRIIELYIPVLQILLKSDSEFQFLFAEQLLPIFDSEEFERCVELFSDPNILDAIIDSQVDFLDLMTDNLIQFLLSFKHNPGYDYLSSSYIDDE